MPWPSLEKQVLEAHNSWGEAHGLGLELEVIHTLLAPLLHS